VTPWQISKHKFESPTHWHLDGAGISYGDSKKFEQEKHPEADNHSNKVLRKSCFRSDTLLLTPLKTSLKS
jgi:hypothetical protein